MPEAEMSLWEALCQNPKINLHKLIYGEGYFGSNPMGSSSLDGGEVYFSEEAIKTVLESVPAEAHLEPPTNSKVKEIVSQEAYKQIMGVRGAGWSKPQSEGQVLNIIRQGYLLYKQHKEPI